MTAGPVSFSPAVRELLAAVLKAIDIPFPATVSDGERYREVLMERAMHARLTLQRVLEVGGRLPLELGFEVGYLRAKLAETPADGYTTWQAAVASVGQRHRKEARS